MSFLVFPLWRKNIFSIVENITCALYALYILTYTWTLYTLQSWFVVCFPHDACIYKIKYLTLKLALGVSNAYSNVRCPTFNTVLSTHDTPLVQDTGGFRKTEAGKKATVLIKGPNTHYYTKSMKRQFLEMAVWTVLDVLWHSRIEIIDQYKYCGVWTVTLSITTENTFNKK